MTAFGASEYSIRFLGALAALGVHDIVVCPGSRSQSLALAAIELERSTPELHVHVRTDERTAGFLALGLSRESARPVAVIVTSGTAVANLHPSILEAHHSDIPMLVLSADRPPEMLGIRSNQTTVQRGIFGGVETLVASSAQVERDADSDPFADARAVMRAAQRRASGVIGRPVHCNIPFREPLSGVVELDDARSEIDAFGSEHAADEWSTDLAVVADEFSAAPPVIHAEPGTIVVAGADAGPRAEALAYALGAPLIAEPSSNARFGPNLVVEASELLASELAEEITRVVVVGHVTLARPVVALIRRSDITVLVVPHGGEEHAGTVLEEFPEVAEPPGPWHRAWVGRWVTQSRALAEARAIASSPAAPNPELPRAEFARAELSAARAAVTRASLARALWQHTWPHDRLVLGASQLIRDTDLNVQGKPITVHSNRGLAGIDGTVSTAIGIALAHDRAELGGTTRALMGDLTFLHDASGLAIPEGEALPRLQIIVGNDLGGGIFAGLEVAKSADPADFRRVQFTPQAVELSALAAAYGWSYTKVVDHASLERALTTAEPGIVEVVL
ncbi:2-succinyl-5-enolpyruvyl-6-hydroxy-3-cyclohexene-1-carboxylic-acid synthase [Humidisolicoccus flavus]|uniref:2-succinyl-5-enolpyruvyl-6-hydroxy-3- cyclohexene-1-carboxylic-acid synthase n=1 Tax=Humidisolicoccus flavus TaxID=3111414 RepID=UPI0032530070